MKDLTVLAPPFLMCAVVIVAIVAFLRHEMGRGRKGRDDPEDGNFATGLKPDDELDSAAGSEASASAAAGSDG